MNTTRLTHLACAAAALAALALAAPSRSPGGPPAAGPKAPAARRTELGKNVFLEVEGARRRVVVPATVCLREGPLEGLLTRAKTKEHEYLLAAELDARHLHLALIAAGAKPGSPVEFLPRYKPARGTAVGITLRYDKGGKKVSAPAREWVREARGKKPLGLDWVFAGSKFVPNREDKTKPPFYAANYGDLVCLCNLESALLDLPVKSPKKFDARLYEAHTERIPAKGTAVEVLLEPLPGKKGAGKK
jgi:hypothetical protein